MSETTTSTLITLRETLSQHTMRISATILRNIIADAEELRRVEEERRETTPTEEISIREALRIERDMAQRDRDEARAARDAHKAHVAELDRELCEMTTAWENLADVARERDEARDHLQMEKTERQAIGEERDEAPQRVAELELELQTFKVGYKSWAGTIAEQREEIARLSAKLDAAREALIE